MANLWLRQRALRLIDLSEPTLTQRRLTVTYARRQAGGQTLGIVGNHVYGCRTHGCVSRSGGYETVHHGPTVLMHCVVDPGT
jgi:hypothetical protein